MSKEAAQQLTPSTILLLLLLLLLLCEYLASGLDCHLYRQSSFDKITLEIVRDYQRIRSLKRYIQRHPLCPYCLSIHLTLVTYTKRVSAAPE